MSDILQINDLTKIYKGGVIALDHVNLNLSEQEIFCLLGANGAGKTTLIYLIFDLIQPTTGEVVLNGVSVTREPVRAKKFAAYVQENVALYEALTGLENVEYFLNLRGMNVRLKDCEPVLDTLKFPLQALKRKTSTYSKGMKQKIGLLISLLSDAPLIVMDEPTSGLDPLSSKELMGILLEMRSFGRTILISSHDVFRAKEVADRIGILQKGRLVHLQEIVGQEARNNLDLERIAIEYIV